VTERLDYFKDAGLNVDIADVQSGARALQSLIGGSADIGVGCLGFRLKSRTVGGSGRSVPVAYP
jgi:NitT/TauT family transport system substrate-binding protein